VHRSDLPTMQIYFYRIGREIIIGATCSRRLALLIREKQLGFFGGFF
jgi:hypothetical protein